MEKELKIRKKRLAVFWLFFILIFNQIMMITANAQDYSVTDSTLSSKTLSAGDTLTYSASSETSGGYSIYYYDYKSINSYTDSASYNSSYAVLDYSDEKLNSLTRPADATFTGWYVDSVYDSGGVSSVTLRAQIAYPITYVLNGGTNAEGNPASYIYGNSNESTVEAATKEGYTFEGWYTDETFNTAFTNIAEDQTGELKLYAKFRANTYTISYELDGGTNGENPTSYTCGIGVESFADASKSGYTFGGWYSDPEFTNPVTSISAENTGEITLYARFDSNLIGAGTYNLKAGVQYQLDSGVQGVSGDNSVYGEGIVFYVPQDGEYIFQ